MKNRFIALALVLSGCVPGGYAPVVSGFNGSSVAIQSPGLTAGQGPGEEDTAEAKHICSKVGKKPNTPRQGKFQITLWDSCLSVSDRSLSRSLKPRFGGVFLCPNRQRPHEKQIIPILYFHT